MMAKKKKKRTGRGPVGERTKVRVAVTMDPVVLRAVDVRAKQLQVSRSAFIEQAVRGEVEETGAMAELVTNPVIREAFFSAFGSDEVLRAFAGALSRDVEESKVQQVMAWLQKGPPAAESGPQSRTGRSRGPSKGGK
jgi:hypothetical protein